MADKLSKQAENAPGTMICGHGLRIVPHVSGGSAKPHHFSSLTIAMKLLFIFLSNPEIPEETAAAQRAMEVCPTLAIANDG